MERREGALKELPLVVPFSKRRDLQGGQNKLSKSAGRVSWKNPTASAIDICRGGKGESQRGSSAAAGRLSQGVGTSEGRHGFPAGLLRPRHPSSDENNWPFAPFEDSASSAPGSPSPCRRADPFAQRAGAPVHPKSLSPASKYRRRGATGTAKATTAVLGSPGEHLQLSTTSCNHALKYAALLRASRPA